MFNAERFRQRWVQTQGDLRRELGFKIAGYVLMPEHFHLLIWPSEIWEVEAPCTVEIELISFLQNRTLTPCEKEELSDGC